jgi:hypothetical protein
MMPLSGTSKNHEESSTIPGAAFRVGKGAIVFALPPKNWSNPKLLEYMEALAKLPEMLNRPVDPLPERTSAFGAAGVMACRFFRR